ncbi:MAG: apolipoprotein N-acyltransferase, partial [Bdellovibrionota bacterium]
FPRPKEVPRDYTPGPKPHVFEIKDARVGPMICFEALYPWLARDLVKSGATVLLNVSNDAWFLKTAAATQHIEQARLRAIELRRYLIRNAGTGISAVVDPTGAYSSEKLPIFTSGIVRGEIFPLEIKTPYALWGDWPVVAGSLGLIGFYFWRKKQSPQ